MVVRFLSQNFNQIKPSHMWAVRIVGAAAGALGGLAARKLMEK